jgi:hypothetical protein
VTFWCTLSNKFFISAKQFCSGVDPEKDKILIVCHSSNQSISFDYGSDFLSINLLSKCLILGYQFHYDFSDYFHSVQRQLEVKNSFIEHYKHAKVQIYQCHLKPSREERPEPSTVGVREARPVCVREVRGSNPWQDSGFFSQVFLSSPVDSSTRNQMLVQ